MAKQIIGTVTKYTGNEHRYLTGYTVRIIAVFKNAARDDFDPDEEDGYLNDDADIARSGGITADDRVEVLPWLEREGRYSFASSDPRAIDLECFSVISK